MRFRSSLVFSAFPLYRPALGLAIFAALASAGCATQAPPASRGVKQKPAKSATAPADPAQWVGRWQGPGAAALTIMPRADGHFEINRRNRQGVSTHYQATAAGGRLYFQRLGKTLAIRPGRGSETGNPALADLSDCLLIVPGGGGYCRRADSADALPLTPGAYVAVKTACDAAQRTNTVFFTGTGIARPGQNGCRATLVSQQGMIFHLDDSCAGNTAGSGANETVSVPDAHHMALAANGQPVTLYRYCATGLLPPALQAERPH
ncbi:hypothetical protein ACS8Y6_01825 [Salinisphaera sp. RV14]|uniref:hypothetical protein n=1 Tax=unclassified Salinisphaera TaxID=2649847 RepID=UPI003F87E7F3